jgi:tetratricopeptide (TPR) repeat protein
MDTGMEGQAREELDYVTMHLVMASIHEAEGKSEAAIVEYSEVCEYDAEIFQVYINRGALYLRLGQFRRALRDFERALVLEPRIASTYIRRGDVFLAAGEPARARQDYLRCLELAPENAVALERLRILCSTPCPEMSVA